MSKKRITTQEHKRYLSEFDRCELCGRTKSLELHHIIPIAFGGPDAPDNWIAICESCHSRLTPRRILQAKGIESAKGLDRKPVRDFIERAVIDEEGQSNWWEIFREIFCRPDKVVCYYKK